MAPPCSNGAIDPGTCTTCPSNKNFIAGACVTPSGSIGSYTPCPIPSGASSCNFTLSWTAINSPGVTITNSAGTTLYTGSASSATIPMPVGVETFIIRDTGTSVQIGTSITTTGACAAGSGSFNGTCVAYPVISSFTGPSSVNYGTKATLAYVQSGATACNINGTSVSGGTYTTPALTVDTAFTLSCSNTGGSGTPSSITVKVAAGTINSPANGSNCFIARNSSSCNINLVWGSVNMSSPNIKNNAGTTLSTLASSAGLTVSIPYSSDILVLSNGSFVHDSITINAVCTGSDLWSVNKCVAPPISVVTITRYTSGGATDGVGTAGETGDSITWTASNSPTGCDVYEDGVLKVSSTLSGSYAGITLPNNGNKVMSVSCTNAGGTGTATATFTVPPPPTAVTASCVAPGTTFTPTWTNGSGFTYSYVRINKGSTADWSAACSPAANPPNGVCSSNGQFSGSYPMASTPGATYSGYIYTADAAGHASTPVAFNNILCTPSLPSVTATAITSLGGSTGIGHIDEQSPSSNIRVIWSAINNPTSCTVYNSSGIPVTAAIPYTGTAADKYSIPTPGLTALSTTYTVKCSNAGGTSAPASATFTIPAPIIGLNSTCVSPGTSMKLNWTKGVSPKVVVQANAGAIANWTTACNPAQTPPVGLCDQSGVVNSGTYTFAPTTQSQTYTWWVNALDSYGNWSGDSVYKTQLCAPTPTGAFNPATASCLITANNSSCKTALSWTANNASTVKLSDGLLVSSAGVYLGGIASGAYTYNVGGGVTVPYGGGDYQIIDEGTNIQLATLHATANLAPGTEWNPIVGKAQDRISISSTPVNCFFGSPYTLNWSTNADLVDVFYSGQSIASNILGSANGYTVSGLGFEPSLSSAANVLNFSLIAKKVGLSNANTNAVANIVYAAKAIADTPTVNRGVVTMPMMCQYAASYTLRNIVSNGNSGPTLKSVTGLNKSLTYVDNYTCNLNSCPTKVRLDCGNILPDTSDSLNFTPDLASLASRVNTISITPNTLELNSNNNKISINWQLTDTDNCYLNFGLDPALGAPNAAGIAEVSALNALITAKSSLYNINSKLSKDLPSGANILSGVTIKSGKLLTLVCGDAQHADGTPGRDGIPDGIYASIPGAKRSIKFNVASTKEQ